MKKVLYLIFELFCRGLSILPKRGIYIVADFLFFIGYFLVGYRKKVVLKNLCNSFPEKSKKEINKIAKKFYRHLADVMIENIAILYMKPSRVDKFVVFKNINLIEDYYKQNKNVTTMVGHYGNWEFLPTIAPKISHKTLSVYRPLTNKYFDRITYKMRQRFQSIPVSIRDSYKKILELEKKGILYSVGLLADQSPPKKYTNYWTLFLNQDTPFIQGPEKIARKFNHVVVFAAVRKKKRGLYEIEFQELFKNAKDTEHGEVTEAYSKALQKIIQEKPELWLWSHKRWKYNKNGQKL
jgi:KDO2-lipid IV(A) lauroyltransferase